MCLWQRFIPSSIGLRQALRPLQFVYTFYYNLNPIRPSPPPLPVEIPSLSLPLRTRPIIGPPPPPKHSSFPINNHLLSPVSQNPIPLRLHKCTKSFSAQESQPPFTHSPFSQAPWKWMIVQYSIIRISIFLCPSASVSFHSSCPL